MARHSFGVKDVVGEVKEGGGGGNTPPPPAGAYKGTLIQMKLQNNKNNDPMLLCVIQLEIKEKHLKKHDGYWVWHRMNLTDQGAPYVNGFLNALAGGEKEGLALQKELWDKGTLTTKSDTLPSDVTKIGSFTIGSPEGKKKIGLVLVERNYTKDGVEVESVDATRFMPISGGTAADPDAGDGLDDDFADDSLEEGDDLDSSPGEGADDLDDDLEETAPEGDPDADAFSAKLDEVPDLKALRLMARDDYSISGAETKGKTEDEVKDMIFDAWDAARAAAGDPDTSDDLDDDLEEKPKATRRGAKSDSSDGEPPF